MIIQPRTDGTYDAQLTADEGRFLHAMLLLSWTIPGAIEHSAVDTARISDVMTSMLQAVRQAHIPNWSFRRRAEPTVSDGL